MKLVFLLMTILMSFSSLAAIGCLPGECPETPRPRPQCPSRPGSGRPFFSLNLNLVESNELKITSTGILIDTSWKSAIYDFALKNVRHPSWGIAHSERDYQMTKILAAREKVDIDLDVLFAASFLHDLGGLKDYEVDGVDHAVRSAELSEKLLKDAGFPAEKLPVVKEIILGHTYYSPVPKNVIAQLFRDADVLDFLGTIGIARILAITSEEGTSDLTLKPAAKMLKNFAKSMSNNCISETCREIAKPRQAELVRFLKSLDDESFAGKAL